MYSAQSATTAATATRSASTSSTTTAGVNASPQRSWRWLYFRKRFHAPIRLGVKTHTLRNQRLTVGTLVACPVGLMEIVDVVKRTPRWVAENRWREEGCESPEDFLSEFDSIHPGEGTLDRPMWLHVFRLIQEA